ncbi:unnamed protein product [Ascophyllum nodosum]
MAVQATLDIPEPRNRRQAMESQEWDEWRKAEETEMLEMVENFVYKQVARSKDKLVVGTKMLYKRKIGQDGKVEKYKCRLFKLKDMGDAGYYMGCHITRNHKARELKFNQHLYVESMVKRFDVKKTTKIPAASGVPTLLKADESRNPEEKEEIRKFPYWDAVGAPMWTATMIRPDIACNVRAVARFCENPGAAHKKAVMKIFQYLLHKKGWGITYGGQGCGLCMEAYSDSDFGACLDTRRSVSGAVLMLARGAINWHSRMREVTASGTSQAEYVALSEVVKKVLFLRQVKEFMEPSMRVGAVNVFGDNEGAIKLATNKHASRSTKQIDVKHHLVRDASDARMVRVAYVRSEDQHADFLTKPLDMQKFYKHAKFILTVV